MAVAKKAAASKKTASVPAVRANTNIVDLRARIAAEVTDIAERTQAATGNKIGVTQDKHFTLPDGRKAPGPIDVVIVDFVSANMFYEGAFDPNNISPPACFAIGLNPSTLVPSPNSPDIQAKSCAVCPNNVFGSSGKGKACKNTRKLAVVSPDATEDDAIMVMTASPTAIKGFDGYVRNVATRYQTSPIGVTTAVGFDPNETYATLTFSEPKPIDDKLLAIAYGKKEEARAVLLAEPDVSNFGAAKVPAKAASRARR